MQSETLKAFYYGNLSPWDKRMIRGSQATAVVKELSDAESLLTQGDMDGIVAETSYIDGFKTGALFMMEILDDARENLKPVTE